MTKARGAADSIGKAGRGASFLLPAFSPYYVPYFPLFLRARARAHTHTDTRPRPYTLGQIHIYIHTYPRSLSFLSSPSGPPPVNLLSYPPSPSTPCSPSASLLVVPRRLSSSSSSLLYVRVRACVRVYVRLVSIVVREVSCRTAPRSRGERAALYVGERENVF